MNRLPDGEAKLRDKYRQIVGGAAIRKIPMRLTYDQARKLLIQPCHYCGDIARTRGLDRLDSTKGYTIKNVVSACKVCNIAKASMTKEEFLTWIQQIYRYQGFVDSEIEDLLYSMPDTET